VNEGAHHLNCAFGHGREKYNKIKWGSKWYGGSEKIREEREGIDAERCNEEYDINDMKKHSEKWCLRLLDTLDEIAIKDKIIKEQEQEITTKDEIIIIKDKTITIKDKTITTKDKVIEKQKQEIEKLKQEIATKDGIIKEQEQKIKK
jgi:uncharacterized protein (DUF3084 family)